MTYTDWLIALLIITQLTALSFGIYFKRYLIKKADIKATNENFKRLVHQLQTTTELTKSIEGKFNNTAWLIQQKWEIKKEFYLSSIDLFMDIGNYLETYSRLLNSNRYLKMSVEVIEAEKEKYSKLILIKGGELKRLVELKGILFLDEDVLTAINIYLNAEHNRQTKINENLSASLNNKSSDPDVSYKLAMEVLEMGTYTEHQIKHLSEAKVKLLKEAKRDLNIVWE